MKQSGTHNRPLGIARERPRIIPIRIPVLIICLFIITGCGVPSAERTPAPSIVPKGTTSVASPSPTTEESLSPIQTAEPTGLAYTYQQAGGNRLINGTGNLPDIRPLEIPLAGIPRWLVGAPYKNGTVWVAVLDGGRVAGYYVSSSGIVEAAVLPGILPADMPPHLVVSGDQLNLLNTFSATASPLTHPIFRSLQTGERAYVESGGNLVLETAPENGVLEIEALPDARLMTTKTGAIILLAGATGQYDHGVLGDQIEASKIAIVDPESGELIQEVAISPPGVIEGVAPILADLTGDGQEELIVTVSDAKMGASIQVFTLAGDLLAQGPPVGNGYRWRHQLAVAPFGPDGELELAVVRTPHIGGIVEFYRLEGETLQIVALLSGYSSHRIGSRNLDSALAGDLDGDGFLELLVPDQTQTHLGAVQHTAQGAREVWNLDIGGTLTSNLAGSTLPDGSLAFGLGHDGEALKLWIPDAWRPPPDQ